MRNFKVSHQSLSINKIDFENNWVCGFTDIIIWPLDPSMVTIHLNAKQIRIHSTKLVTLQSETTIVQSDLTMSYHDPFMAVTKKTDHNYFNLEQFVKNHASAAKRVDLDEGIGELTLQIPREFWKYISEYKPLKLTVEFSLYKPKAGLYFVKPPKVTNTDSDEGGMHLYTCIQGNMSRLWFPCIDASEPCTWKIEITVSDDMTAISCGTLLDTVYTPDLHSKVFHYYLKQPVAAFNIGMVVGEFELYPDPLIPNFNHFCLPRLLPLLRTTVECIPDIFKFLEEKLNFNYPFDMYKTVFVDSAVQSYVSYASMTIFDVYMLHPNYTIDQSIETIETVAEAIPEQFFGQFTIMRAWPDIWVPWGISGYLGRLFIKKVSGTNEYRFGVYREMMEVVTYEEQCGGIVLDPVACTNPPNYSFSLYFAQASNPAYMKMYKKKAAAIIRLLELKLGPVLILKVFRKLLHLATMVQNSAVDPNCNMTVPIEDKSNLLLCSDLLAYAVDLVSGLDISSFINQWVSKPGHVRIHAEYIFNRRRNVIELYIKQMHGKVRGCTEYLGPIDVATQEFEGYFRQKIRIERPNLNLGTSGGAIHTSTAVPGQSRFTHDIVLHTKVRKHRRRKVTLSTGQDVDIDLPTANSLGVPINSSLATDPLGTSQAALAASSTLDGDAPYLWLELDPKMTLFGKIEIQHSPRAAFSMLKFDPDSLGQARAIQDLVASRELMYLSAVRDATMNPRLFYRVRIQAAQGLRELMNSTSQVNQGGLKEALITLCFTKTDKSLVKSNDFSTFSAYRLQIALIRQLALLQTAHGQCPSDVPSILHGLLLYNENSSNRFSDHHYKAEVLMAMADAIRIGVFHRTTDATLDCIPVEVRSILRDVLRCLTLDQTVPTFNYVVTRPCLLILRRLQHYGYIADDPSIFYQYINENNSPSVRRIGIYCLINCLDGVKHFEVLQWLLSNVLIEDSFTPSSLRSEALLYLSDKIRGCYTGTVSSDYCNIGQIASGHGGGLMSSLFPWQIAGGTGGNQHTQAPSHDAYRFYWHHLLPTFHRYIECQVSADWQVRSAMIQVVRSVVELTTISQGQTASYFYEDGFYHNYFHHYHQHYPHHHLHHQTAHVPSINPVLGNSPQVNIGRSNMQSNDMGRLSDDSEDDMM